MDNVKHIWVIKDGIDHLIFMWIFGGKINGTQHVVTVLKINTGQIF